MSRTGQNPAGFRPTPALEGLRRQRRVKKMLSIKAGKPGRRAAHVAAALWVAALLLAAGCTGGGGPIRSSGEPAVARLRAEDFFPAEPGMRWRYEGWGNEFAAYQAAVTHRRGNRAQIVRTSGASVAWVYEIEPHRVVLRAMKSEIEDEGADFLDLPAEFEYVVLQEPLAAGAEWRTPTWIRRSFEDGAGEAAQGAAAAGAGGAGRYLWETRRIEAVGQTLTTPAGTFRNVIRVRVIPDEHVPSVEYYAPGVGMIHVEHFYDDPIGSALASFSLGRG